jgi:uncharacterized cupin superfamily protein
MPNVFEPDWDEPRDQPGMRSPRAPIGEEGAHQLRDDGDRDVRFLAVSSQGTAEVVVHPDTDRIAVADRRRDGTGLRASFRRADAGR